ncbi:MAG: SMC family ATPase, partial [Thermoproteus sp.]|nr:SMC family ATPase [Thermoproteus sp.]
MKIELKNFKVHEELTAQFVEGINFVHGPNGAGKTSLLEAVAVALFGSKWLQKTRSKWADLLRRGAPEGEVRLKFVGLDGVEYAVVRRFSASGTSPAGTLLYADGRLVARGDQDVTAAVAKALGMGVDEFANVVYIRQGELRKILAEPDYIDRLFRLDEFDKLDDVLRDVLAEVGRRRARAEGRAEELERRAGDLRALASRLGAELEAARREAESLRQYHERFKAVEAEYANLREKLASLEQEAKALRREVEEWEKALLELEIERSKRVKELEELKALEAELAALPPPPDPDLERRYFEAKKALDVLSSLDPALRNFKPQRVEELKAARDSLIAERGRLASKLALARDVLRIARAAEGGGKCPVCGGPLGPETARRHAEEAKRLEEELRRAEASLASIEVELRRAERLREEYLRHKDYLSMDPREVARRVEELERAVEVAKAAERRRVQIEVRLKARGKLEEELRALEAKKAELAGRLDAARRRLGEIEAGLARMRPKVEELAKEVEGLREKAERYIKASARAEELARQLKAAGAELERAVEELESARAEKERLAKAEARGLAVRGALKDLKPLARKILINAVNAELNSAFLRLRHKEAFKSAALEQDEDGRYVVVVARADGQRFHHASLSLGEVNLVALALRVALAKALFGRPPLLILDEPTEHLDEEHRRRIVELVRDLSRDVKTVVVTSH